MSINFKGRPITAQRVLNVMSDFDKQYPNTNDYDSWLNNSSYKYAVDHGGRLYPCKHILSRATGLSTALFNGGEQTNSVFRRLGFRVIDKPIH